MTQDLKIRAYLMQNLMELDMKKISDPKGLTFGIWGLKARLGQFGHKTFGKGLIRGHYSTTLVPVFTKRTSFSPES